MSAQVSDNTAEFLHSIESPNGRVRHIDTFTSPQLLIDNTLTKSPGSRSNSGSRQRMKKEELEKLF